MEEMVFIEGDEGGCWVFSGFSVGFYRVGVFGNCFTNATGMTSQAACYELVLVVQFAIVRSFLKKDTIFSFNHRCSFRKFGSSVVRM